MTTPRPTQPPADLAGDLIQPGHPLFGVVWINPERMSGAPCFFRTRVPVQHLFDNLRAGVTIEQFLSDFSGITREQVEFVLDRAAKGFFRQLGLAA